MRDYFNRSFEYNNWANRETLSALRQAATLPPRSQQFMAHIVASENLWLFRLRDEKKPIVVWPDLTLDQCAAHLSSVEAQWKSFFEGLEPNGLNRTVSYVNTKGQPFENRVEDILTHVLLHASYHRGQVASDLRTNGLEPAYTDFIHCVRNGLID